MKSRCTMQPLRHGYEIGMKTGKIFGAMNCLRIHGMVLFATGSRNLPDSAAMIESEREMMEKNGNYLSSNFHRCTLQIILNLMGDCEDPRVLSGRAINAPQIKDMCIPAQQYYYSLQMQLAFLFGDYDLAGKYASESRLYGIKVAPSNPIVQRHFFFQGLVAFARGEMRSAKKEINRLRKWEAKGCVNCHHLRLMLEAELAAKREGNIEAALHYKQAIIAAENSGIPHDQALAHELAGHLYERSEPASYKAAFHYDKAIQTYQQWGARGKVDHLLGQVRHLIAKFDFLTEGDCELPPHLSPTEGQNVPEDKEAA
jgi:tetratricopeptide (TPR) repeat protein